MRPLIWLLKVSWKLKERINPVIVRELITLLGFKLNDGPAKQYDQQIENSKQKGNALAGAAKGISVAWKIALAVVAVGAGRIAKSIFETTAETEKYRVALGAMIGDQEKANKLIHDLDYSPLSDMYGTASAIGGLQGLVTFGVQAEEASDILMRLGDIAQGDSQALTSMGLNMGQVFAKGKADATDLKQFVTQGFDVVGVIAQQTGKSREQIEKAGVTYAQTLSALKELTNEGGKYHGLMAKNMNTLSGLVQQVKSLIAAIKEAIGFGVSDYLKDLIRFFLETGRAIQENLVKNGIKALKSLLVGIATVIVIIQRLNKRLADVGGIGGVLKKVFGDIGRWIAMIAKTAIPILVNALEWIIRTFSRIWDVASPVFTKILSGSLSALPSLLKIAGVILGIVLAFRTVTTAITAFNTAQTIASGLASVFSGDLLKMSMGLQSLDVGQKAAMRLTETFGMLTGKVDLATAAQNKNRLAQIALALQSAKTKIAALAVAAVQKVASAATAAWDFAKAIAGFVAFKAAMIAHTAATYGMAAATKIAAAAQAAFNAVMAANPIALIIIGIIALIATVVLLVKNWDKIGPAVMGALRTIGNFFTAIGKAAADFFIWIWSKITGFFSMAMGFVKKNLLNIVNAVLTILFPIAGIVMVLVRLIIKHWDTIKAAFIGAAKAVAAGVKAAWDKIVSAVQAVVGRIKAIWQGIVGTIAVIITIVRVILERIWNAIVGIVQIIIDKVKGIWESLTGIVAGVTGAIRRVWQDLVEFISPFWDWFGEKAASAWEGIKNAFASAVDWIRGIWDGFVGFFTGAWDKIKGAFTAAANFLGVGGGDSGDGKKRGGSAALSGASGITPAPSLAEAAAVSAAGASSRYSSSAATTNINVNSNISTVVPEGTSPEQKAALERQAREAVRNEWASIISGARGMIPAPEGGRSL
jgi:tape measure domain-containing protein